MRKNPDLLKWVCAAFLRTGFVLVFLVFTALSHAHDPGLSVVTAHLNSSECDIHLAMSPTDVQYLVPVDTNHDGKISQHELVTALSQLQQVALSAFEVKENGRIIAVNNPIVEVDNTGALRLNASYTGLTAGELSIRSMILSNLPTFHRQYLSIRDRDNKLLSEMMLDASQDTCTATLAKQFFPPTTLHLFREFLQLGMTHIATGYDHMLFLLGLLMLGGSFKSALKIITSFTAAHSITLALATMNFINFSPRMIEALIAVTIIYVGVENIFVRNTDKRWMLAFGFGLIHGCGFASSLRALGIGSDGTSIIAPLCSFNLGVEIAQMTIAAMVLPVIWDLKGRPDFVKRFVPVGSSLIALAGTWWLLERTLL